MNSELSTRQGLPDALRALVEAYPRDVWLAPSPFQNLISFWMEKHMSFRRLLTVLEKETQTALDGGDARRYRQALARYGGMFVNDLHGHHQIEDAHYFPVLENIDPIFAKGLRILDADHHALDHILNDFVAAANEVLQQTDEGPEYKDGLGRLHTLLERSGPMLVRHFDDEEDLVVPVLLKHEPEALKF